MKKTADTRSRLEKIMDSAVRNNPHSSDIIKAFRPVLIEKNRLAGSLASGDGEALAMDEAKFREGVPLGDQNSLFFTEDPWKTIALTLIPELVKGFPALAPDLERLQGLIEAGTVSFDGSSGAMAQELASAHGIGEQAVLFLSHMAGRVILEMRARDWGKLLQDFTWEKGYCPLCGGAPMIAKIREGQSARILHCSQCGHEWTFSRVICPSCGNTEQKTMSYFFVEDKAQESTFVCERCRHYLITADRVSDLIDFDADVCALSLVHLDVIMQEKGYLPMASCAWNTFSPE